MIILDYNERTTTRV